MFCMEPAAVLDEPVGTEWATSLLGVTRKTVSGWVVDGSLTVHGLRRTAASMMLRAGVAPMVVSRILGHASLSITVDLYGHLVPEQLDDAAEAVERLSG
jgi:integrase